MMSSAVTSAVIDVSRKHPYRALSRRLVAERAGVPYPQLCAHFSCIHALLAETCLQQLRQTPITVEFGTPPRDRVVEQFHQLIMLLAYEPRYGSACVRALMSKCQTVQEIRQEIDAEINRRLSAALGSGAWPEMVFTLQLALLGAVAQAATGDTTLGVVTDQLGELAEILLPNGNRSR